MCVQLPPLRLGLIGRRADGPHPEGTLTRHISWSVAGDLEGWLTTAIILYTVRYYYRNSLYK